MLRLLGRSRLWRGFLATALLAPLLAAALVFWQASRAKDQAAIEIRASAEHPFRIVSLDHVVPAGVDPVVASPDFRDLAEYHDSIVVSGRAGLFIYDRKGTLTRTYRAGLELPPVELGGMSVGVAAGSAEPEVFLATRGEGALAFNGDRFRQILPSDAALRTITSVLVLGSGRILF